MFPLPELYGLIRFLHFWLFALFIVDPAIRTSSIGTDNLTIDQNNHQIHQNGKVVRRYAKQRLLCSRRYFTAAAIEDNVFLLELAPDWPAGAAPALPLLSDFWSNWYPTGRRLDGLACPGRRFKRDAPM
eukprot:5754185-Amphidinium_carterae.1